MIGQHKLRDKIEKLIDADVFPKFCIIVGPKGSGKKTLVDWIESKATKFDIVEERSPRIFCHAENSVDAVREVIESSYRHTGEPCVYCFTDADNMSVQAKNAILKITEEPPKNCSFIMTLEDLSNTLDTIKSRAVVFQIDPYSSTELSDYLYTLMPGKYSVEDLKAVKDICEYPGEVSLLMQYGVKEFKEYVELVIDNISEVSDANSFKIPSKIALKPDADGYDLKLFLKAFMVVCLSKLYSDPPRYSKGVAVTSKFIQQSGIKGISKQMLIDAWIMEMRKAWCE